MSSALSSIPVDKRRHLAATLGLFAALFIAVGVVATTGTATGAVRVFSSVSLGFALLLLLISWGVMRSIKIDLAEQKLDDAIEASIAALGRDAISCGCGHDHDPDELQIKGDACAHDGSGTDCTHSCDTCVLASMRPDPTRSRAARLAE